jgi:N-carbamoyl-L-amino-acid hydrolase
MSMMADAGLDVSIDAATNIIGRRRGELEAPAILFGSHIDTVPDGGRYDGILGSLAGIECLKTLEDAGVRTRHPLEVVVFANEEGQSYNGLMGSRAMVGELRRSDLAQTDSSGRPLAEVLKQFGGNPGEIDKAVRTGVRAYLELHVEQGGILDTEGINIGVVEGIVGIRYLDIRVIGNANHAGTTPMELRRDALVAASRFIVAVHETLRTGNFCRVGTVGKIEVHPNARNVVPETVWLTLGLRDMDVERIDRTADHLRNRALGIGEHSGVRFEIEERERMAPAHSDEQILGAIRNAADRLQLSHRGMPSGAGHDAQMMARIAPMGMIFVPSAEGISHSGKEFTSPEDCANGTNVLLQTILEIDAM